jgi:hypothetical protein
MSVVSSGSACSASRARSSGDSSCGCSPATPLLRSRRGGRGGGGGGEARDTSARLVVECVAELCALYVCTLRPHLSGAWGASSVTVDAPSCRNSSTAHATAGSPRARPPPSSCHRQTRALVSRDRQSRTAGQQRACMRKHHRHHPLPASMRPLRTSAALIGRIRRRALLLLLLLLLRRQQGHRSCGRATARAPVPQPTRLCTCLLASCMVGNGLRRRRRGGLAAIRLRSCKTGGVVLCGGGEEWCGGC